MRFTKEDSGNLADILWYLFGLIAANQISGEANIFHNGHIETLRSAREVLDDLTEENIKILTKDEAEEIKELIRFCREVALTVPPVDMGGKHFVLKDVIRIMGMENE